MRRFESRVTSTSVARFGRIEQATATATTQRSRRSRLTSRREGLGVRRRGRLPLGEPEQREASSVQCARRGLGLHLRSSHVSRLTSHVSRLTSHVSRLTSHVSRLTSHVHGLASAGRRPPSRRHPSAPSAASAGWPWPSPRRRRGTAPAPPCTCPRARGPPRRTPARSRTTDSRLSRLRSSRRRDSRRGTRRGSRARLSRWPWAGPRR